MTVLRFSPKLLALGRLGSVVSSRASFSVATRAFSASADVPPLVRVPEEHDFFVPAWQRTSSQKESKKKNNSEFQFPTTVGPDVSELCYLNERSWDEPVVGMMIHGLMGCAANWKSVMRRVCNEYSATAKRPIEIILVDLRNHGDSTLQPTPHGQDTIGQCATDLVSLFDNMIDLPLPNFVIGHSFGGKVALEYARQAFLPPQKVLCLDTAPESVPTSSSTKAVPAIPDLIEILQHVPNPVPSQRYLYQVLRHKYELSENLARWMVSNLRANSDHEEDGMSFKFSMDNMGGLYESYQQYSAWDVVQAPPSGTSIDWVCGENSPRWTPDTLGQLHSRLGRDSYMRVLPNAGHWLHVDNPVGLSTLIVDSLKDL
mmetsp:Transcript_8059/g.33907  ORF Transcript_8059/g.33907 Transcript_8059/m.33907 type:complete len:372 (-) Transcript_8059:2151-3266(-)